MDAASPDKASMDPSVAINVRVEEDEASATKNTDSEDGADDSNEIGQLLYNVPKKKNTKTNRSTKPNKENN